MTDLEQVREVHLKDASLLTVDLDEEIESTGSCSRCLSDSVWKCLQCWNVTRRLILAGLNGGYDLLTLIISIADVTTDVWVIYNFYVNKQITFFTISLIVLILAQVAYCFAFMLVFSKSDHNWQQMIIIFACILPLSPIVSFIFFFTAFEGNYVSKFFGQIGLHDGTSHIDENSAPIIVWIEKKARKHVGFILESIIEALPQSIIQLIAIVYFQETKVLNVVSIIISLTSVATKSMVFSFAIDFKVVCIDFL